jgi:hypothetical protein
MLGTQVCKDLDLDSIDSFLPLQTSWGKQRFREGLTDCKTDKHELKNRQLPLLAMRIATEERSTIRKSLENLQTEVVDDCIANNDSRIKESVGQIFWAPNSLGGFLNASPIALNVLCTWKTLVLPGFAIIMPLLAIIVPFFVLHFLHPEQEIQVTAYMEHLRTVLLQQIAIPSVLRSKSQDDRFGVLLESLFIGMTLVMFISSIWNQISASIHLRRIWFDLESRGTSLRKTLTCGFSVLKTLKSMPLKLQTAMQYVIDDGEITMNACAHLHELDNVATFGSIWNNNAPLIQLKNWLGLIDVYTSISALDTVCFPTYISKTSLILRDVIHPEVSSCISNNLHTTGHIILTGPNRGGKSTLMKSVALAVVTGQSWGFAWAKSMKFRPFATISTALEPCGKLGVASTFEAEIEFAKSVLAAAALPHFVMMDEIFHSTNATDGVAASQVFLRQLYEKKQTISIVSTHYRELTQMFAKETQQLQLVATEDVNGKLVYSYMIAPGVSTKSSVMEILAERGLLMESTPGK